MTGFLQLLLAQVRERKLVYVWLGLMLATWLWFDFVFESRMDGTLLTGAAFFYATVTLIGSSLWTWGKQRTQKRPENQPATATRAGRGKKRRKRSGTK